MIRSQDPRLREFIRLFNSRRYFHAHEVLETLWLDSSGKTRDFYKGLIQCAAAFVHLQRGNPRGAKSLFRKSTVLLKAFVPYYSQINTAKLLDDLKKFSKAADTWDSKLQNHAPVIALASE